MKPYLPDHKQGTPKVKPDLGRGLGVSKLAKLVAKNANRANKKAYRQYQKLIMKREVEDLPNEPIYQVEDILRQAAEDDDLTIWKEKGILNGEDTNN